MGGNGAAREVGDFDSGRRLGKRDLQEFYGLSKCLTDGVGAKGCRGGKSHCYQYKSGDSHGGFSLERMPSKLDFDYWCSANQVG